MEVPTKSFKLDDTSLSVKEKVANALDYLLSLNDPKVIIDDKLAYQAFFCLAKCVNNKKNIKMIEKKKVEKLIGDVLCELGDRLLDIDFTNFTIDIENQENDSQTENDRRISLISFIMYIINIIMKRSFQFSTLLARHSGIDAHLKFLKDDKMLEKIINVNLLFMRSLSRNLVCFVVLNLCSMSKNFEENAQKWIDSNTLDILLKVARLKPETELDAYLAISNIATDKQIETLTEVHKCTSMLCKMVLECGEMFKSNKFDRYHREIIEDEKVINVQVCCFNCYDGTSMSILVLLKGLYKLAVNDNLRSDIYYLNNEFHNSLKTIMFKGNEIERKYALRLLCQLSFNAKIAKDISNDNELMDFLNSKNEDEKVNQIKSTIIWNINPPKTSTNEKEEERKGDEEHIMISYNSGSRPLCLQIKSKLEEAGYKVWIDVNDIHGSSLDSMARAVEDARTVLICITEKYRQSLNCQAEAQYAFKMNKHIVPIIMEKGYENVKGWLGIIMSDKIFINFTRYDFDECIRRLKSEISSRSKSRENKNSKETSAVPSTKSVKQTVVVSQTAVNEARKVPENADVEKWSENEVLKWLNDNEIDKNLISIIMPCNGIILKQLFELRRDAPEFYFQMLNSNKNFNDFKTVLKFTNCLNNLF